MAKSTMRRPGEVGPLDDDRRAAAGRGIAAVEGGDRGRTVIGELVCGHDGRGAPRGRHGDVDRAGPRCRQGRSRRRLTMILPAVFQVMVAGLPAPKSTAVAAVRFVPVMITLVPPAGSPVEGATEVMIGTPAAAAGDTPTTVKATPKVPKTQGQRQSCLRESD